MTDRGCCAVCYNTHHRLYAAVHKSKVICCCMALTDSVQELHHVLQCTMQHIALPTPPRGALVPKPDHAHAVMDSVLHGPGLFSFPHPT